MPAKPQKAAMSGDELKRLVERAGYADTSPAAVAKLVGFSRVQWWRLLTGKTPISARSAAAIRAKLKPKK